MIDELLYAIPESGLSELQRYSVTTHAAFSLCTSAIGCAIGTTIQYITTDDSNKFGMWIVISISAGIAIVSGGLGLLTRAHKNSYLNQLKRASKPVDATAMLRLLSDAQKATRLEPHKSADDQHTDPPASSGG
jgi:uncharacterized membrane protein AbrB (regulator of aidB expression)